VQSSDHPPKPESGSVSGGTGANPNPRHAVLVKPKKEKQPASISGFKSSVSATASILPGKKPLLPASSLIYQDADVGLDLGSMRRAAAASSHRRPGFIKPADVDSPTPKPVLSVVETAQVEQKKRASDASVLSTLAPEHDDSPRKKRKRYSYDPLER
jgi:hypothetical protein